MLWMNVDKPTKRCTLHLSQCRFVKGKKETTYKGDGEIKRDGGWLSFQSLEGAVEHYESRYSNYDLINCSCS